MPTITCTRCSIGNCLTPNLLGTKARDKLLTKHLFYRNSIGQLLDLVTQMFRMTLYTPLTHKTLFQYTFKICYFESLIFTCYQQNKLQIIITIHGQYSFQSINQFSLHDLNKQPINNKFLGKNKKFSTKESEFIQRALNSLGNLIHGIIRSLLNLLILVMKNYCYFTIHQTLGLQKLCASERDRINPQNSYKINKIF